jgi:ion channel-forming bestrophin family protein
MYVGRSYKFLEFLIWTRKSIYWLIFLGVIPVVLYQLIGLKWLAIPWTVVALLGTATAFIVGFKNTQTYSRALEAHQIWTTILSNSRAWGILMRDFLNDPATTRILIYRHLAWLTALRFQMREYRIWESTKEVHNVEYQKYYTIPEKESKMEAQLAKYLSGDDLNYVLSKKNRATQILALQSKTIKQIFEKQEIVVLQFVEMERAIKDFYIQQSRSEQIKDFPYPRQYAIINTLLVKLFCFMLPLGMLKEFDRLNDTMEGLMKGNMVWMVIPFSVIISWMYTSLGQVGESTENPFEGSANDIPITQFSQIIEIDLREMLDETNIPKVSQPKHDIIL